MQDISQLEECERSQNYSAFVEKHRTPTDLLMAVRNQNTMAMRSVKFGERPETDTMINLFKEAARHDPQNSATMLRCASVLERASDLLSVKYSSMKEKKAVEKEIKALQAEITTLEVKGAIHQPPNFGYACLDAKDCLSRSLTTIIESVYLPPEIAEIMKSECSNLEGQYRLGTKPDLSGILAQLQVLKQRGDKNPGGDLIPLAKPIIQFTGIKGQPGVKDQPGFIDTFSDLIENKANLPLSEVKAKLQELYLQASAVDFNVVGKREKTPQMWTTAAIAIGAKLCAHIDHVSKSLA